MATVGNLLNMASSPQLSLADHAALWPPVAPHADISLSLDLSAHSRGRVAELLYVFNMFSDIFRSSFLSPTPCPYVAINAMLVQILFLCRMLHHRERKAGFCSPRSALQVN